MLFSKAAGLGECLLDLTQNVVDFSKSFVSQ